MCGLCGAVVGASEDDAERVRRAVHALRHRGPNHQESCVFEFPGQRVWLGHTRLSVIDLSSEANQPMQSEDGRFVLVFNGEIYNYVELRDELRAHGVVFHTTSDTEVLLKAWVDWGESCLDKLDGMFAFVILDKRDQTLTCVRDPFGIKPFFYSATTGRFVFASELPAILELLPTPAAPDVQSAYDYLVHGDYDSSGRTFVDGVHHLQPAHMLVVDVHSGAVRTMRRWWSPAITATSKLSFDDAADAIREEFLKNVRRQLRSDVALGAALSGGVDSSALVCGMRHVEPDLPIHTFSYVAGDDRLSEERWVDIVTAETRAVARKAQVESGDLVRDLDDMVRVQGEPFGSTSIYAQYRVFQLARECGVTVTLDGQGADELFAGYHGYAGYRAMSLWNGGHPLRAAQFLKRWREWPGRMYRLAALDIARASAPDSIYGALRAGNGRRGAPAWMNINVLRDAGVVLKEHRHRVGPENRTRRAIEQMASSVQFRGLPGLLRHGDRNSMRFSVESRVPFLTRSLCELAYSLPEEYLISGSGETKHAFRAAMRGIVPDAILNRKDKVGFVSPQGQWLVASAGRLREWLDAARGIPCINATRLWSEVETFLAGRHALAPQVWRWVNYVRWFEIVLGAR